MSLNLEMKALRIMRNIIKKKSDNIFYKIIENRFLNKEKSLCLVLHVALMNLSII